jgi:hypothetical protein
MGSKKRINTGTIVAVAIGVVLFLGIVYVHFMTTPVQHIYCFKNSGCSVYEQDTIFSKNTMRYNFKPQDIESYETKSVKYGSDREYYPVIKLKDGTEIKLNCFTFDLQTQVDWMMRDIKTKEDFKKDSPISF